mgnify:FL=1
MCSSDLGKHLLTFQSVVPGVTANGNAFVEIEWSNPDGKTIRDRLYPIANGEHGPFQSYKYKSLAHAILPEDGTTRFEFFTSGQGLLPVNPELWTSLVGLTVEGEVVKGSRGYTIEPDGEIYKLFDMETSKFIELPGGVVNEFSGYKEAREAAKTAGLFRAYNNIKEFSASGDHVKSNQEAMVKIINELTSEG